MRRDESSKDKEKMEGGGDKAEFQIIRANNFPREGVSDTVQ